MKIIEKVINLTSIKNYYNYISDLHNYELVIIKNYSNLVTAKHNTYKALIDTILNNSYHNTKEYPYSDISLFYNEKTLLNKYEKFILVLEYYIFKEIDIHYYNVYFKEIVKDGDELLVKFIIEYEE